MSTAKHTPGPWHYQEGSDAYTHIVRTGDISRDNPHVGRRFLCQLPHDPEGTSEANARLIAAAPDLLAALMLVRSIIVDAAATGFNCHDGDWAERLFASQAMSHRAVAKAEGRS